MKSVAVGSDGTVFLAIGWSGLRAYAFDSNSFTLIAQINNDDGSAAIGVAIGLHGDLLLANYESLSAYTYSGYTAINENKTYMPTEIYLYQNFPNPFNPSTTIEFTLPNSE